MNYIRLRLLPGQPASSFILSSFRFFFLGRRWANRWSATHAHQAHSTGDEVFQYCRGLFFFDQGSRRRPSPPSPSSLPPPSPLGARARPSGLHRQRGIRQRRGAPGSSQPPSRAAAPVLLVVHATPAAISSHELLGSTPGRRRPPRQARRSPA